MQAKVREQVVETLAVWGVQLLMFLILQTSHPVELMKQLSLKGQRQIGDEASFADY